MDDSHFFTPIKPGSGLRFGVATSSHQIEGALRADGRGRSVWEDFCDLPGKIENGQNAETACDHYHRWESDLDHLAWLGVDAYRFSISWTRILPDGTGRIEPRGLDFYERLVDGLLARGIEPVATLFHWDLPSTLWEKHRGWLSRETSKALAEYSVAVFKRLHDRVRRWMVLNEPCTIHSLAGYELGVHAPGFKGSFTDRLAASHHQLLGFAMVREAFQQGGWTGSVGYGDAFSPHRYAEGFPEELKSQALDFDFFWYLGAIHEGRYPLEGINERLMDILPKEHPEDCRFIQRMGCDFLGVNYYTPRFVFPDPDHPLGWKPGPAPDGAVDWRNSLHWPIIPSGLTEALVTIHRRFPEMPLFVSENGTCDELLPAPDGQPVQDSERCRFLLAHLSALQDAIDQGVPVSDYFHWSFMDNFEWAKGYRPRFGLFSVDYPTQERRPKRSAHLFRETIQRVKNR